MTANTPTLVAMVTGAGPGLGTALCRALLGRGYAVAALARSPDRGAQLAAEISGQDRPFRFFACDVGDAGAVDRTVAEIEDSLGAVSVLVHNAAELLIKPFEDTTPEEFEAIWRVACLGGMASARAVLPGMRAAGGGTILFTGATAALRGGANFSAFAAAKFAQRGLAQSLAREYGKHGIHVAHVVVDGLIWGDQAERRFGADRGACLEPDAIAGAYLGLIEQDRSAWSQEIDLRPWLEAF